jgi:hypothetical protein
VEILKNIRILTAINHVKMKLWGVTGLYRDSAFFSVSRSIDYLVSSVPPVIHRCKGCPVLDSGITIFDGGTHGADDSFYRKLIAQGRVLCGTVQKTPGHTTFPYINNSIPHGLLLRTGSS